ncbi:hypothetical protein CDV36_016447 [Fusarium kuroshium]|uniref:Uncharacterized protein n=2 Tax=Fusarium solani species complex TaxID=232080 RepID=A0A3M2QP53_9HYPO|nr:hypothetical protein CDV36_016447 [Fusarium kuroshium]RSL74873.1 hypothetical protein CEP52_017892 [Fusarium oligoseptatum]
MAVSPSYDKIAAKRYRNRHRLPRPLDPPEEEHILDNIDLSLFQNIDITTPANQQQLGVRGYINLAILGAEAFLAATGRLMVPQRVKRFVRRDELVRLESFIDTEPDATHFADAMRNNEVWVQSLLKLLEQLREARRRKEARHG